MVLRWTAMLKDAGMTAFVAAALGIFVVGFRTVDVGSRTGLSFDYALVDVAIAVATIFVGRLGLLLAAAGLRWPAISLGVALAAVGVAPLTLPSTFLHGFIVMGGLFIVVRGIWPWASEALGAAGRSPGGVALQREGTKWFGAALLIGAMILPMTPLADQKTVRDQHY